MLVKEGKAATPSSDVSQGSRGGAGGDAAAAVLQRKLQLQSGEALVLSSEVVDAYLSLIEKRKTFCLLVLSSGFATCREAERFGPTQRRPR